MLGCGADPGMTRESAKLIKEQLWAKDNQISDLQKQLQNLKVRYKHVGYELAGYRVSGSLVSAFKMGPELYG